MIEDIAIEYEALLQFLYMAPIGLIQMNTEGDVTLMNPMSAQLLMPISRDGSLSNLFSAIEPVAPELRNMTSSFSQGTGTICERIRIQVNAGMTGVRDPQILAVSLIKLDVTRIMAVIVDVSLEVKRERQIKQSEAWFNALMNDVNDYALMSLDRDGKIDKWNASIERICGLNAEAVVGKPYSVLYPTDTFTAFRVTDYLEDAGDNGWVMNEGWCLRADGNRFWSSSLIVPIESIRDGGMNDCVLDGRKTGYALIVRDITKKNDVRDKLLKASLTDHLTGVSNRRAFFESAEVELKRFLRSPRPLSLLVLDADHFKKINDTYGHPAGDKVLQHLAGSMKSQVRELDIVARIGGEEFAILFPSAGPDEAYAVAERIRKVICAASVEFDGLSINYTVSIGICSMHEGIQGMDEMLKLADQALYVAKRNGRNCVEFAVKTKLT